MWYRQVCLLHCIVAATGGHGLGPLAAGCMNRICMIPIFKGWLLFARCLQYKDEDDLPLVSWDCNEPDFASWAHNPAAAHVAGDEFD